MLNLDTNFGALIFPYHPKNWDDLNKSEKMEKTIVILKAQYTSRENELRKIAKTLSNLSRDQLPEEFRAILSPSAHMEIFKNRKSEKNPQDHRNQTLCLLRFSPEIKYSSISMKKESLDTMFESIKSRVKI